MAPIDRPQSTNRENPRWRSRTIMLSLCRATNTNVLLLLHAVGHEIALALAAARKIEGAEGAQCGDVSE